MTGRTIAMLVAVVLSAGGVWAQTPASMPATAPAAPSPAVMKILADLEKAGEANRTIQSEIVYEVVDRLTGDKEHRTGGVYYQRETEQESAKFRVTFNTLRQGDGPNKADKVDYAFDGEYLSVAKERIKNLTRYQVAAPGQRVQTMRLGKGPFPLPFGQKADDVLEHFEVVTRAPAAGDIPNSDYLKLTPREAHRQDVSIVWLEMWVDRSTHLPVKIVNRDKDKKTTTVVFRKIRANERLTPQVFHMDRPAGWTYEVKPLENAKP